MMQQDDDLEELGRNPPDVTLHHIVKDLLSFFNGFECLHEAKRTIEKKCAIKKEPEHKCWSEDYIRRAWKETIKEDIKSSRRKHWAHVIMLQVVKSFDCDTCKENAAQKNCHATTDEQGCDMRRNPEDRSSQSKAELKTMGPAGAVEQMFGAGEKISEVSKLLASSSDVAPSPTEVNPTNCETKMAALMNEDEDTLVNNCQQQKNIDYYDLHVADVNDNENVRWDNGLRSTCGKAESMRGNSEDRPSQSSAEPETVDAAGGVMKSSRANHKSVKSGCNPTGSASQRRSQTGETLGSRVENMRIVDETIYIRIPVTVMFGREPGDVVQPVQSPYKLINGFPSNTDIRKRKSYAMSFSNASNNAEWVYEILNRKTLANNCVEGKFGHGYVKGHLAAAANHRWCREANNDANLFSNIIPQNGTLNNSTWKILENTCRNMFRNNEIHNVHVYTGPLYLREEGSKYVRILDTNDMYHFDGKVIPTHLFKVIIVENEDGTVREPECYLILNDEPQHEDLNDYRVDIEYIEEISGLIFKQSHTNLGDTESIITVAFQGEDLNEEQCEVDMAVRIV